MRIEEELHRSKDILIIKKDKIGLALLLLFGAFCCGTESIAQVVSGTPGGAQPQSAAPAKSDEGVPLRGAGVNLSDALEPPPAGALSAVVGREIEMKVSRGASPTKKMKALHITIQNKSDQALVFEGGLVTLESKSPGGDGNGPIRCISQSDLDALKRPPTTFKGKLVSDTKATVTAAASIGAVQTAEGILNEHGPILKRYEWDESRRENEESRFGKRLLYPGDVSDGEIFFPFDTNFEGMTLKMPVKSFYDGSEQTSISKVLYFGG